ncbi:hypothetical protein GC097_20035 [Paenibacillus sp. LMG 31457]|uniref:Uncharacterized protein n=2 Tax=Paenibacillus planticolens TaxID=2654976 RepID=A0ABX1ZTP4_9BACL|nr:hypothetical protein [Paenibacillus planticolens]
MHMYHDPETLSGYHFVKAEHFERMKMANANNPALYYQYAEQEYCHKALAHRYKGMAGWMH